LAGGFLLPEERSTLRWLFLPEAENREPETPSAMLRGMRGKPKVVIVGAGNFATALAVSLRRSGYEIEAVISRSRAASLKKARSLAEEVGARTFIAIPRTLTAELVWFCVPDSQIGRTARAFAEKIEWKGRIALHSSGVLASDELAALRSRGAAVASVHPLMTFVRDSRPPLAGVPFAVEGDAAALRLAARLIKDLCGHSYSIRRQDKAAYHAWATFASPLFTALLAMTERVAASAGVKGAEARRRMIPILLQTLANYASLGAAGAFSGPIVRGDVDTVKRHLQVLGRTPEAREVYLALARAALRYLPAKHKAELKRVPSGGN
jgi:predicted short-subunit dehydrogenase-like oxidoreductase (DUF2520 family)